MTRARLRLVALPVALVVGGVLASVVLGDDLAAVRSAVRDAGAWGGVVFVVAHVVLCLVPVPRTLLSLLAGTLFGVAGGIGLSLVASWAAAALTFTIARGVGREAVASLAGPRTARVERLLAEQGLVAVVVARLTPVAPFVVTNYGSGLSAVRGRDYALGTLVGVVPGSVAWATVGGSTGADPTTLAVGASVGVVLLVTTLLLGRRFGREGVQASPRVDRRP
ncbi:TVP38/TMEM64 family protein [Oryzobacter terrae]|uniref:TVP38/TMEM64 family protein n=1 Tax=Oryzobacter terrae TaxID=1620385 RepID=UPI00366FADA2